jgi:hypothetical protein
MNIRNLDSKKGLVSNGFENVTVADAIDKPDLQPYQESKIDASLGSEKSTGSEIDEIIFLRARIQHLEVVIETARSLLSSNQDRLIRRLHEIPMEFCNFSAGKLRIKSQDKI